MTGPCASPPSKTSHSEAPAQLIPIHLIDTDDPNNGRLEFDPQAQADFCAAIADQGLLHPITLASSGERFTLVAGGRRLAAARQLGWNHIEAKVKNLTPAQQAEIRLVENAERRDITPVEEAAQLSDYLSNHDATPADVAKRLHRSLEWVKLRLTILHWPGDLVQHIHHGRISLAAGKSLAQIPDETARNTAIEMAARNGVTAAVAREWLRDAQRFAPTSDDASQISGRQNSPEFISTTSVDCFSCKRRVDLHATLSVRLCTECLRAIAEIPAEPPDQNPPTHEPLNTMLGPA